jgi:subtilisin family serine protease
MTRERVVRRFDIQASGESALIDASGRLRDAAAALIPGDPKAITITRLPRLPMMSVRIAGPAAAVARVAERVARSPGVTVYRDVLDVPVPWGDSDYPDRRALLKIDPDAAATGIKSTARVVVAIVDSGLTVEHPDLRYHLWREDVGGRTVHGARRMGHAHDHDVADQDGHGTKLAGTIVATANRVQGLELLPVKFFDVITQPLAANAAEAIYFAVSKGAAIILMSFDLGLGSNELRDAIRTACRAGALIVIAAGNTGSDNDRYPAVPASYARERPDSIITVMATDWADTKPAFSNFGARSVDLAAPGVGILSTRPLMSRNDGRRYTRYTGTSAAAAHVAGAAALLKSQNPTRTAPQLKTCLMGAVDALPNLKCVSGGRLNLGRALTCKP